MIKTDAMQAIFIPLIIATLSLVAGCPGQNDQNGQKSVSIQEPFRDGLEPSMVGAKNWRQVFEKAKNYALGSESLSALESQFSALSDEELKALASHKADDGNSFVSYLVAGKASRPVAAMVEKLLDRVDADVAEALLAQKVKGQSPFERLKDAGRRPSGEASFDRRELLSVLLKKKPALVNELDETDFNFMVLLKPSASVTLLSKLDAPRFLTWLTWAMGHRATSKAGFKHIYGHADKGRKEQMRNTLLETLYGRELNDMLDARDPWGLRSSVGADVYELAKKPLAATKHQGSLLCVTTLRAIDEARFAGYHIRYVDLRSLATRIKAQLGPAYEAHVTAMACGAAGSIKEALDLGLTPAFTGYSHYYLDLVKPEKGLMAAVDEPLVTNAKLHELQTLLFAVPGTLINLSQINLAALGADTYLQKLLKRPIDGSFLAFRFLDEIKTAGTLDAQLNHQGAAGTADGTALRILFNAARLGDDPVNFAALADGLLKNAAGASIDALVAPNFLEDFVQRVRNEGHAFQEIFRKVNDDNKAVMRSKLLNLAYARGGMVEVLDLLRTIHAGTFGFSVAAATDVYRLSNRAGTGNFEGTLLFVLAKRAIEDAAFAGTVYGDLNKIASHLRYEIFAGNAYYGYATGDVTLARVQGGESAYSVLEAALVASPLAANKCYGCPQYYLQLSDPRHLVSGYGEALVMAAVDQTGVVSNEAVRFLYLNSIGSDGTGAKAVDLAGELGTKVADNFLNRAVTRPMDEAMTQVIADFLRHYQIGRGGPADLLAMLRANGAASGTNALSKLLSARGVVDDPEQLKAAIVILVRQDDGSALALAADNDDKVALLLDAVHSAGGDEVGGFGDEMIRVFNHLDDARMPKVARWSAAHLDADYVDPVDAAQRISLGKIFNDEAIRRPARQVAMLNALVSETYRLGALDLPGNAIKGGIDELTKLAGFEFLDKAMIERVDLDPFGRGHNGMNLFYAALDQAIVDGAANLGLELVNDGRDGLAAAFRRKFAGASVVADWQTFLTLANNSSDGVNFRSLVDFVQGHLAVGGLNEARAMLAY